MTQPITVHFFAEGVPVAQPRHSNAQGGRTYYRDKSGKYGAWRDRVTLEARHHAARHGLIQSPPACPVRLYVKFLMPYAQRWFRKDGSLKDAAPTKHLAKPDADNMLKLVKDVLESEHLVHNDSMIYDVRSTKLYSQGRTGAIITLHYEHGSR